MFETSQYFKFTFILVLSISFLYSCNEIFEEDLSRIQLSVNSPQTEYYTNDSIVYFWWDKIEQTDSFRLEISTPSFLEIQDAVYNDYIIGNEVYIALYPDTFEWRLYGVNNLSSTIVSKGKIYINTIPDLSEYFIEIVSPINNTFLCSDTVIINWNQLDGAETYRVNIYETSEGDSLVKNPINTIDTFLATTLNDGWYKVQIFAENQISLSLSGYRYFNIDRIRPKQPILISPNNYDSIEINSLIEFSWSSFIDEGSPIYDSLVILDSLMIKKFAYKVEQGDSMQLLMNKLGEFSWCIKSYDLSGNNSNSDTYKFTIYE